MAAPSNDVNAHEVLCAHILGAIHFAQGGHIDALETLHVLALPLVHCATYSKKAVLFCRILANVRDDVTRKFLVTHHMNSMDHDICPVLEDLLEQMFATIDSPNEATNKGHGHDGFELDTIPWPLPLDVSEVVRYATPIQGVVDLERLGNVPVCVAAVAASVLKKINALAYVTQYSPAYRETLARVEEQCEALAIKKMCGQSGYYKILFDNLAPELWICMKLEPSELCVMARLVQSPRQTWKDDVIAAVYKHFAFPPMPGSGNDEKTQNVYLAAQLEDVINLRYGGEKINNPTLDQKIPFMYLALINMRIQRALWQLRLSSVGMPEKIFPIEWDSISAVPPYTLANLFDAGKCTALILESSHHSHSCLVARTSDGFIVHNAATGLLAPVDQSSQIDPCVLDAMQDALWRARCIHLTDDANIISERAGETMYRLLEDAGLPVLLPPAIQSSTTHSDLLPTTMEVDCDVGGIMTLDESVADDPAPAL